MQLHCRTNLRQALSVVDMRVTYRRIAPVATFHDPARKATRSALTDALTARDGTYNPFELGDERFT